MSGCEFLAHWFFNLGFKLSFSLQQNHLVSNPRQPPLNQRKQPANNRIARFDRIPPETSRFYTSVSYNGLSFRFREWFSSFSSLLGQGGKSYPAERNNRKSMTATGSIRAIRNSIPGVCPCLWSTNYRIFQRAVQQNEEGPSMKESLARLIHWFTFIARQTVYCRQLSVISFPQCFLAWAACGRQGLDSYW